MGEIDPIFIQEPQHRPKPTITKDQGIPQIDLSPIINSSPANCTAPAIQDLIGEVHDACKDWGFFQVFNHGVPPESREKLLSVAKRFFEQPVEVKRKVRKDIVNPIGYNDTEHTKNVRDWKEVFDVTVEDPTKMYASPDPDPKDDKLTDYTNRWPEYPQELRDACEEYQKDVQQLAYKLLELVSLSLNLPANRLNPFFSNGQTSYYRVNHYVPCPAPDLALGIGRHKDSGVLTILAQDDVGGLEVKRKPDGDWIFVKPIPNTFIVNVGAVMQVWSNDMYESVEHRVIVNSTKERFSIPFFLAPSHNTMVEPLAELINEQNPARYMAYSWGKFLANRKQSNFKKSNVENIQIYHFKIPEALNDNDGVSQVEIPVV